MKPGYKIKDYKDANDLIANWDWNERWLRSALAKRITGVDISYLDNLGYRGLRHQGHRLLGVAKKIVKTTKDKGCNLEAEVEPGLFPGLREEAQKQKNVRQYWREH